MGKMFKDRFKSSRYFKYLSVLKGSRAAKISLVVTFLVVVVSFVVAVNYLYQQKEESEFQALSEDSLVIANQNDPQEARQAYIDLLEEANSDSDKLYALNSLATTYLQQKDAHSAREVYFEAVKIDDQNVVALNGIVDTSKQLGDIETQEEYQVKLEAILAPNDDLSNNIELQIADVEAPLPETDLPSAAVVRINQANSALNSLSYDTAKSLYQEALALLDDNNPKHQSEIDRINTIIRGINNAE